jgi:endoglucanase
MKKLLPAVAACIIYILIFVPALNGQGFLHRVDKKIVNGSGQEVVLEGIGLGGWLLQEGYMLQTSDFANAQWQIRERIVDLIGEAKTEEFYEKYRQNFIRRIDIDSIKSWGFNSVRLPFHYNLFATNTNPPVFLEKGFEIVDTLLAWCEANEIYLILDMHAAPGGQSDEPISDYNPALPSLWESEQNKSLTVKVWRKIAERYKDEVWIGGYDLLNEPKWNLPPNNQPLRDLYIRLTDTIRAVDNNHLIFIEGNWFATDFNGLTPPWDENMSYSFHKYWNVNNQGSVQGYMDLRANTNVPLWLGETGENSNKWFVECVELMKNNNVGWAWWPLKKIESIAGPVAIKKLPAYETLLNYWKGQGPKPTAQFAFDALMSQAEKMKLENCIFQKDVVDALIRQPRSTATKPFAANEIPGIIHAADYDMGKVFYAYSDNDTENTGGGVPYNQGRSYRNDGVDIEKTNAFLSNGYNVGWIQQGEFLKFTVNVAQSGIYNININISAPNAGGKIYLTLNNQVITPIFDVPSTGGWQNWQFLSANGVYIPSGQHALHARFPAGGFNLCYVDFEQVTVDVKETPTGSSFYNLEQNYPNPFNPVTNINYSLEKDSFVTLIVYDISGNEISRLEEGFKTAGKYQKEFNGRNLSSGLYLCKLETEEYISEIKMILVK